jgi:hypothetical protein
MVIGFRTAGSSLGDGIGFAVGELLGAEGTTARYHVVPPTMAAAMAIMSVEITKFADGLFKR